MGMLVSWGDLLTSWNAGKLWYFVYCENDLLTMRMLVSCGNVLTSENTDMLFASENAGAF